MIKRSVIITLMICSQIHAEVPKAEWLLFQSNTRSQTYIDPSRIKAVEGSKHQEVDLWTKIIVDKSELDNEENRKNNFKSITLMSKYRVRCSDKMLKTTRISSFKNNELILDQNVDEEYKEPLPDSVDDVMVKGLCKNWFNN